LTHFEWSALFAAVGLASLNYAFRFLKWQYYLRLLDIRGVAAFDSLLVFLSGFVLTVTPGKVGEVFKSAVLHETHGVPVEQTAPIVVAERLTDVIGIVVLILVGSASFEGGQVWATLGLLLVFLGLLAIFWEKPSAWVLTRLSRTWMAGLVPKLETAWQKLRQLSSLRALVIPSLLSIVAWGLEGVALYVLLRGFSADVPVALATFFYATATLAGALTPLPGGLGVTETLIQQQLVRLAGVGASAATASMLMVRLATLWWAVAVGFLALGVLKLRHPQLLGSKPDQGAISG
jgi:uncharacterized protein (TIRG00374 family)